VVTTDAGSPTSGDNCITLRACCSSSLMPASVVAGCDAVVSAGVEVTCAEAQAGYEAAHYCD
jgi:hypothetical protein